MIGTITSAFRCLTFSSSLNPFANGLRATECETRNLVLPHENDPGTVLRIDEKVFTHLERHPSSVYSVICTNPSAANCVILSMASGLFLTPCRTSAFPHWRIGAG